MKKILSTALLLLFVGFGNLFAKDISTYLTADYIDPQLATQKLKNAGFEVIAEYQSVKNGVTIVFTNEALKKEAAKPNRAHAAVLRLFIDKQEQMISFTNPVYFGKAFMQKEYDAGVFEAQVTAIESQFTGLKGSNDKLDDANIAGYHFMMSMPYYEDSDTLAKGEQLQLLEKARAYKKGKLLVFELKLSDESTLLGYDLDKRTKKFVEKIGRANAAVLPYCISVENGKASSLEAKYYLAVSYPLLSMTTFTTIATIPGAIKKDLEKVFK